MVWEFGLVHSAAAMVPALRGDWEVARPTSGWPPRPPRPPARRERSQRCPRGNRDRARLPGLTPAEQAAARLVAAGRSNRQTAAEL